MIILNIFMKANLFLVKKMQQWKDTEGEQLPALRSRMHTVDLMATARQGLQRTA